MFKADLATTNTGGTDKIFTFLTFLISALLGIYIFFNPFPHTTAIKEFCFYLSLAILIVLILCKKTSFSLSSPLTLPFILFFIWSLFGLFFALDVKNSLHDLWAHYLKYLIIFYLLINYFSSEKKLEILAWIVVSSATIFSVGAMIFFYFIAGNPFTTRLGNNFLEMHTNYIGFTTIFAINLAVSNFHKNKAIVYHILLLLCFLILCFTTLLTQSRSNFLGLMIALFILSFYKRKIMILIAVIIVTLVFVPGFRDRLSPQELAISDRNQINLLTLELIKNHPLTGIGFGMQTYGNSQLINLDEINKKLPPQYQQKIAAPSPHNTILDITVRTGIIGIILFINIIFTVVWMLWKIFQTTKSEYFKSWLICLVACLASFFIPALFEDTTFGPRAIIFYTILAMITILWNLAREETASKTVAS